MSTPMLKQYMAIKDKHQGIILFYRLGDFYETFLEDAIIASKALEITLTSRDAGANGKLPRAGIPVKAVHNYMQKLLAKGLKVAICEQVEDPKAAKGIVKRDVIRVITPGTIIDNTALDEKKNNFIMCI